MKRSRGPRRIVTTSVESEKKGPPSETINAKIDLNRVSRARATCRILVAAELRREIIPWSRNHQHIHTRSWSRRFSCFGADIRTKQVPVIERKGSFNAGIGPRKKHPTNRSVRVTRARFIRAKSSNRRRGPCSHIAKFRRTDLSRKGPGKFSSSGLPPRLRGPGSRLSTLPGPPFLLLRRGRNANPRPQCTGRVSY